MFEIGGETVWATSHRHQQSLAWSEIQAGEKMFKNRQKKRKQKFVLVINQHEKNLLTFNELQVDCKDARFQSGIQSGIKSY